LRLLAARQLQAVTWCPAHHVAHVPRAGWRAALQTLAAGAADPAAPVVERALDAVQARGLGRVGLPPGVAS